MKIMFALLILAGFASAVNRPYYHTERISDGQVRVVCENNADATIRPTEQFGSIIVDCGNAVARK